MEPENAIELEAFDRLNVAAVKDHVKGVFQHVPENYKLKDPGDAVVIIGDVDVKPFGGGTKDGSDDVEGTLTILTVLVAKERAPVWRIKKAVKDRLDQWNAVREGWRVRFDWLDGDGFFDAEQDAYVGSFKFKIVAIAA